MFRRSSKNLVYLFILFVPFFFFFIYSSTFSQWKFKVIERSSPVIQFFSMPIKEFKKILYYHRIFDEYKRLNREVSVLKTRLMGMEEVIRENRRLELLLNFKRSLLYSSVVATVIGRDPSYWDSTMIIDKGKSDGIRAGMPVVNASGVVGKIAEVGDASSKIILLTDPQFSVAALIQRPRESVLVAGSLEGICRLKFIAEGADIHVGDQVITSKLSSSFPESLLIGEVTAITKNPNSSLTEGVVKPAVSLSQIEEVLVILK